MKNRLHLVLPVAAIVAAAIVYALFFRPSDADRIHQKLALIEGALKRGGSASEIAARPQRVQQAFSRVFAPTVVTELPGVEGADTSRDELARLAASADTSINGMEIAFSQVHLEIDPRAKPPRADVEALATVTGTDVGDVTRRRSVYQVTLHFESREGDWRVTRVAAALAD